MNIGIAASSQIDMSGIKLSGAEESVLKPEVKEQHLGEKAQEERIDLESFQGLLDKVNKEMKPYDTQLEFSIHEKTKQVMIKVINTSTKETIREIPSEKLMDIMANLLEVSGILVDIKA